MSEQAIGGDWWCEVCQEMVDGSTIHKCKAKPEPSDTPEIYAAEHPQHDTVSADLARTIQRKLAAELAERAKPTLAATAIRERDEAHTYVECFACLGTGEGKHDRACSICGGRKVVKKLASDLRAERDRFAAELKEAKALLQEYKEQCGCPLCASFSAQLDQSKREAAAMQKAWKEHRRGILANILGPEHAGLRGFLLIDCELALSSTACQDLDIPRADEAEIRKAILAPANCGVSGHFKFQENGGHCMMCQTFIPRADYEALKALAYMPDQDGDPSETLWSKEADDWYKHAVKMTDERDALKADYDRRGVVLREFQQAFLDSRCTCYTEPDGTSCDYCRRRNAADLAACEELKKK